MWSAVIALFREYMGTGLIVIWYFLSLLYLFLREKRKSYRILFLYVPLFLLFLYFNPLFSTVVYGVAGEEIYYRILWLLPITLVIAYTSVQIYGELRGGKRVAWVVAVMACIIFSGSYVYENPYFHPAENKYHVPDSIVQICDAIVIPGREVMAVFPIELVQYVRQYSPVVCMPYGREATVERWTQNDELCEAMEKEVIDLKVLAPLAKDANCHYIILRQDKKVLGRVEDYNWTWFGGTAEYTIYRDLDFPLVMP